MKEELKYRTKEFAKSVFNNLQDIDSKFIDYKRQLIRSSSSVGANYRAACRAKSMNDFINKWYNPESINKFVFFLKSPKNNPAQNEALVYRHYLGEIPGFHRKLLYLLGDLFPTFEFMKKRYKCKSSLKSLVYYPLRWGKLWYLVK